MELEDNIVIPTSSQEELKPPFPYMKNVIRAYQVIHMWPNTGKTNPIVYHFVVVFVFLSCLSLVLLFAYQIKSEYKDLASVCYLISTEVDTLAATLRYIYIYFRGSKYVLLVSEIHNNFIHESIFPKKNRASMQKYYKYGNNVLKMYGVFSIYWLVQFFTAPLFSYIWNVWESWNNINGTEVEYPIPMEVYVPFDYKKQPANALFYIYQCTSMSFISWIYVMNDCFWYLSFALTMGQFDLLEDSIETIAEVLKKGDSTEGYELLKETDYKEVEEGLKRCIKQHQFIRKFVLLLDDISSPNIFVDTVAAAISMGFILLETTISLKLRDWGRVQSSLIYISSLSVHIFLYNALGNELTTKEEELGEAIYRIPWHKCPKIKPLIVIMTIQTRRPSQMTAGKTFKLSLEFFLSMMQAAFSYFTFFLNFVDTQSD